MAPRSCLWAGMEKSPDRKASLFASPSFRLKPWSASKARSRPSSPLSALVHDEAAIKAGGGSPGEMSQRLGQAVAGIQPGRAALAKNLTSAA